MDREFGDYLNHDLAQYHVAVNADVGDIEAHWIDEDDGELNPMGSKGIGEIGIVGAAAAVANAVFHATGMRVRDLPIRLDRVLASRGGGVEHDLDVVAHLQRAHEAAVGLDAPAVWMTEIVARTRSPSRRERRSDRPGGAGHREIALDAGRPRRSLERNAISSSRGPWRRSSSGSRRDPCR